MNKYECSKKELKDFCDANEWRFIKAAQRQFADAIINEFLPQGLNAVKVFSHTTDFGSSRSLARARRRLDIGQGLWRGCIFTSPKI